MNGLFALRSLLVSGALAITLGQSGAAHATPQYPGAIDQELMVNCPDPLSRCLICHTTAAGGKTAFQVFALTLKDNNFYRPNDPTGLRNTLRVIALANTDSDGDGVPDIEELRQCRNPSGGEFDSGPEYGCDGAHLAPAPHLDRWGLAAAGLLGLGLCARLVGRARVARAARRCYRAP
jgi:hypothetical protein